MKCCVKFCTNDNNSSEPLSISFHKFPAAEWRRQLWMEILNIKVVKPWTLICSNHFQDTDFIQAAPGQNRRLFPSAMPFLPDPLDGPPNEDSISEKDDIDVQQKDVPMDENVEGSSLIALNIEKAIVDDNHLKEQLICSKPVDQNIYHDGLNILPPSTPPLEEIRSQSPKSSSVQNAEIDLGNSKKKKKKMTLKMALSSLDEPASSNLSPREEKMKKQIEILQQSAAKDKLKIKSLLQNVRRNTKRIASLEAIISGLKSKNLKTVEETSKMFDSIENIGKEPLNVIVTLDTITNSNLPC